MSEWLALTLPLPTLALVGFGLILPRTRRFALTLTAAACLFCLTLAGIGSVLYPRYILPVWPMLLLVAGLSVRHLGDFSRSARYAGIAVLSLLVVWGVTFAAQYASDPARAPLTAIDRRQYIELWTAGYNLPDIYAALRAHAAERGAIIVISPIHERVIHFGPAIYLRNNSRISFINVDFRDNRAGMQIADIAAHRPVYLTLDAEEVVAFDIERRFPELKRIREWRNPHSAMAFYLYAWSP